MMAAAVPSRDEKKSVDFYTKGLGMAPSVRVDIGNYIEVFLTFPGGTSNLVLMVPKTIGAPLPVRNSLNRLILDVPDIKALEARLSSAGYKLKGAISDRPQHQVRIAFVDDPDGNIIELVQRLR